MCFSVLEKENYYPSYEPGETDGNWGFHLSLGLDYSTMFVMYMIGVGVIAATGIWRAMSFLGLISKIKISKPHRKLFMISYSSVSSFMFDSCKNDYNWNICSLINGKVEFAIMCM